MPDLNALSRPHIINALKLDLLPEDERVALLDQVSSYLNEKLLLRIFEELSDADQEKFRGLIEKADEEQFGLFVNEKVPNFLELLSEEIDAIQKKLVSYGKK